MLRYRRLFYLIISPPGKRPRREVFNRDAHSSQKNNSCTHPHLLPAHRQVFDSSASGAPAISCRSGPFAFHGRRPMQSRGGDYTCSISQGLGSFDVLVDTVKGLQTNSARRGGERLDVALTSPPVCGQPSPGSGSHNPSTLGLVNCKALRAISLAIARQTPSGRVAPKVASRPG